MSSAAATNATEAPAEAAEAPKKKKKKGNKLLIILLCLLAMGFLRVGFLFLVIGLLPAIVVSYFDRSPHRYLYKTVLFCNMSAMLPSVTRLLVMGPKSSVLQEIMGNGTNWALIYFSAFGGMFLVNLMPMLAQILVGGFHQTRVSHLQGTQQKIEAEWGQEVTQFSNKLADDGAR